MAEGFEPYHVPQQSRRDKLRVVISQNHRGNVVEPATAANFQHCAGLLPLYDPVLLSTDLLTCANASAGEFHHQNLQLSGPTAEACKASGCSVKEESFNLMGFVAGGMMNGASSSSSAPHPSYLDIHQNSLPDIPSSIQDINSNPFLYPPRSLQNVRGFDQSYNGGEVVAFKPEPLSLSLSSHATQRSNLPLELNIQRYGSSTCEYVIPSIVGGSASASNDVSRSSVPLGPFTGYASVLKGSRFLKPAQQLLEELCDFAGRGIYAERIAADSSLMDSPMESLSANGTVDTPLSCGDGGELRRKKSRLISMLDEVYRRYKQYYEQMQAVVTSFENVAGLGNAAPYANLAVKAMSKHFRFLKNAITDQLQFTNKARDHGTHGKDEASRSGNNDRGLYCQRPIHSSGFQEHQPVWRPQRGLPERAVTVLRAWLFEHFLHPYPTDTDKLMLAKETGLSRSQVSNWFINARVRLWKPMVEEIHTLETRQAQRDERTASRSNDHVSSVNTHGSYNPSLSNSNQRVQDTPSKRTRNEVPDIPMVGSEEAHNLSFNFPCHSRAGGSGGVSLTLGLHQNNGIGLSESFPMNAAQRIGQLGLETNGEGYVMGGFESHNRNFGDVIGGQLLHDFVG